MSNKPASITVRLGEELLQKLRIAAAYNGRSMNAEAVHIVDNALNAEDRENADDIVSPEEWSWVQLYRSMSDEQTRAVISFLETVIDKRDSSKVRG